MELTKKQKMIGAGLIALILGVLLLKKKKAATTDTTTLANGNTPTAVPSVATPIVTPPTGTPVPTPVAVVSTPIPIRDNTPVATPKAPSVWDWSDTPNWGQ